MSDKSDKGKQPAREISQDKWAMDLAESGGLEINGSSMEQPVEAGSSSKYASLAPVGQPLYVSVSPLVVFSY
jgi:hypothetical protein